MYLGEGESDDETEVEETSEPEVVSMEQADGNQWIQRIRGKRWGTPQQLENQNETYEERDAGRFNKGMEMLKEIDSNDHEGYAARWRDYLTWEMWDNTRKSIADVALRKVTCNLKDGRQPLTFTMLEEEINEDPRLVVLVLPGYEENRMLGKRVGGNKFAFDPLPLGGMMKCRIGFLTNNENHVLMAMHSRLTEPLTRIFRKCKGWDHGRVDDTLSAPEVRGSEKMGAVHAQLVGAMLKNYEEPPDDGTRLLTMSGAGGTGKSLSLQEILEIYDRETKSRKKGGFIPVGNERILLLSAANAALDGILQRVHRMGSLKCLRILSRTQRLKEGRLLPYDIEVLPLKSTEAYRQEYAKQNPIRVAQYQKENGIRTAEAYTTQKKKLKKKHKSMKPSEILRTLRKDAILSAMIEDVDLIALTTTMLTQRWIWVQEARAKETEAMKKGKGKTTNGRIYEEEIGRGGRNMLAIVDEASTTADSELWCAAASCHLMLLLGDHRQTRAHMLEERSSISLFERSQGVKGYEIPYVLPKQFRVDEELARWSLHEIYGEILSSGKPNLKFEATEKLVWVLCDTIPTGKTTQEGVDIARMIRRHLTTTEGMQEEEIAVLTPYNACKRMYNSEIKDHAKQHLLCHTIKSYQGKETSVVIVILCMSSVSLQAHTNCWRLANVAFFRGKSQLIIIMNEGIILRADEGNPWKRRYLYDTIGKGITPQELKESPQTALGSYKKIPGKIRDDMTAPIRIRGTKEERVAESSGYYEGKSLAGTLKDQRGRKDQSTVERTKGKGLTLFDIEVLEGYRRRELLQKEGNSATTTASSPSDVSISETVLANSTPGSEEIPASSGQETSISTPQDSSGGYRTGTIGSDTRNPSTSISTSFPITPSSTNQETTTVNTTTTTGSTIPIRGKVEYTSVDSNTLHPFLAHNAPLHVSGRIQDMTIGTHEAKENITNKNTKQNPTCDATSDIEHNDEGDSTSPSESHQETSSIASSAGDSLSNSESTSKTSTSNSSGGRKNPMVPLVEGELPEESNADKIQKGQENPKSTNLSKIRDSHAVPDDTTQGTIGSDAPETPQSGKWGLILYVDGTALPTILALNKKNDIIELPEGEFEQVHLTRKKKTIMDYIKNRGLWLPDRLEENLQHIGSHEEEGEAYDIYSAAISKDEKKKIAIEGTIAWITPEMLSEKQNWATTGLAELNNTKDEFNIQESMTEPDVKPRGEGRVEDVLDAWGNNKTVRLYQNNLEVTCADPTLPLTDDSSKTNTHVVFIVSWDAKNMTKAMLDNNFLTTVATLPSKGAILPKVVDTIWETTPQICRQLAIGPTQIRIITKSLKGPTACLAYILLRLAGASAEQVAEKLQGFEITSAEKWETHLSTVTGLEQGNFLTHRHMLINRAVREKYGSEVPEVREVMEQNSSLRSAGLVPTEEDKAALPPYRIFTLESSEDPIVEMAEIPIRETETVTQYYNNPLTLDPHFSDENTLRVLILPMEHRSRITAQFGLSRLDLQKDSPIFMQGRRVRNHFYQILDWRQVRETIVVLVSSTDPDQMQTMEHELYEQLVKSAIFDLDSELIYLVPRTETEIIPLHALFDKVTRLQPKEKKQKQGRIMKAHHAGEIESSDVIEVIILMDTEEGETKIIQPTLSIKIEKGKMSNMRFLTNIARGILDAGVTKHDSILVAAITTAWLGDKKVVLQNPFDNHLRPPYVMTTEIPSEISLKLHEIKKMTSYKGKMGAHEGCLKAYLEGVHPPEDKRDTTLVYEVHEALEEELTMLHGDPRITYHLTMEYAGTRVFSRMTLPKIQKVKSHIESGDDAGEVRIEIFVHHAYLVGKCLVTIVTKHKINKTSIEQGNMEPYTIVKNLIKENEEGGEAPIRGCVLYGHKAEAIEKFLLKPDDEHREEVIRGVYNISEEGEINENHTKIVEKMIQGLTSTSNSQKLSEFAQATTAAITNTDPTLQPMIDTDPPIISEAKPSETTKKIIQVLEKMVDQRETQKCGDASDVHQSYVDDTFTPFSSAASWMGSGMSIIKGAVNGRVKLSIRKLISADDQTKCGYFEVLDAGEDEKGYRIDRDKLLSLTTFGLLPRTPTLLRGFLGVLIQFGSTILGGHLGRILSVLLPLQKMSQRELDAEYRRDEVRRTLLEARVLAANRLITSTPEKLIRTKIRVLLAHTDGGESAIAHAVYSLSSEEIAHISLQCDRFIKEEGEDKSGLGSQKYVLNELNNRARLHRCWSACLGSGGRPTLDGIRSEIYSIVMYLRLADVHINKLQRNVYVDSKYISSIEEHFMCSLHAASRAAFRRQLEEVLQWTSEAKGLNLMQISRSANWLADHLLNLQQATSTLDKILCSFRSNEIIGALFPPPSVIEGSSTTYQEGKTENEKGRNAKYIQKLNELQVEYDKKEGRGEEMSSVEVEYERILEEAGANTVEQLMEREDDWTTYNHNMSPNGDTGTQFNETDRGEVEETWSWPPFSIEGYNRVGEGTHKQNRVSSAGTVESMTEDWGEDIGDTTMLSYNDMECTEVDTNRGEYDVWTLSDETEMIEASVEYITGAEMDIDWSTGEIASPLSTEINAGTQESIARMLIANYATGGALLKRIKAIKVDNHTVLKVHAIRRCAVAEEVLDILHHAGNLHCPGVGEVREILRTCRRCNGIRWRQSRRDTGLTLPTTDTLRSDRTFIDRMRTTEPSFDQYITEAVMYGRSTRAESVNIPIRVVVDGLSAHSIREARTPLIEQVAAVQSKSSHKAKTILISDTADQGLESRILVTIGLSVVRLSENASNEAARVGIVQFYVKRRYPSHRRDYVEKTGSEPSIALVLSTIEGELNSAHKYGLRLGSHIPRSLSEYGALARAGLITLAQMLLWTGAELQKASRCRILNCTSSVGPDLRITGPQQCIYLEVSPLKASRSGLTIGLAVARMGERYLIQNSGVTHFISQDRIAWMKGSKLPMSWSIPSTTPRRAMKLVDLKKEQYAVYRGTSREKLDLKTIDISGILEKAEIRETSYKATVVSQNKPSERQVILTSSNKPPEVGRLTFHTIHQGDLHFYIRDKTYMAEILSDGDYVIFQEERNIWVLTVNTIHTSDEPTSTTVMHDIQEKEENEQTISAEDEYTSLKDDTIVRRAWKHMRRGRGDIHEFRERPVELIITIEAYGSHTGMYWKEEENWIKWIGTGDTAVCKVEDIRTISEKEGIGVVRWRGKASLLTALKEVIMRIHPMMETEGGFVGRAQRIEGSEKYEGERLKTQPVLENTMYDSTVDTKEYPDLVIEDEKGGQHEGIAADAILETCPEPKDFRSALPLILPPPGLESAYDKRSIYLAWDAIMVSVFVKMPLMGSGVMIPVAMMLDTGCKAAAQDEEETPHERSRYRHSVCRDDLMSLLVEAGNTIERRTGNAMMVSGFTGSHTDLEPVTGKIRLMATAKDGMVKLPTIQFYRNKGWRSKRVALCLGNFEGRCLGAQFNRMDSHIRIGAVPGKEVSCLVYNGDFNKVWELMRGGKEGGRRLIWMEDFDIARTSAEYDKFFDGADKNNVTKSEETVREHNVVVTTGSVEEGPRRYSIPIPEAKIGQSYFTTITNKVLRNKYIITNYPMKMKEEAELPVVPVCYVDKNGELTLHLKAIGRTKKYPCELAVTLTAIGNTQSAPGQLWKRALVKELIEIKEPTKAEHMESKYKRQRGSTGGKDDSETIQKKIAEEQQAFYKVPRSCKEESFVEMVKTKIRDTIGGGVKKKMAQKLAPEIVEKLKCRDEEEALEIILQYVVDALGHAMAPVCYEEGQYVTESFELKGEDVLDYSKEPVGLKQPGVPKLPKGQGTEGSSERNQDRICTMLLLLREVYLRHISVEDKVPRIVAGCARAERKGTELGRLIIIFLLLNSMLRDIPTVEVNMRAIVMRATTEENIIGRWSVDIAKAYLSIAFDDELASFAGIIHGSIKYMSRRGSLGVRVLPAVYGHHIAKHFGTRMLSVERCEAHLMEIVEIIAEDRNTTSENRDPENHQ